MSDSAVPTTNVEKRIVDKLTDFYRPMRLCEIVKALGIHKGHCIDLLKNLVAKGIIAKVNEFGKTLYCPTCLLVRPPYQMVASVPPSFSSNVSEFKFNIHESKFESESESNSIKKEKNSFETQGERSETVSSESTSGLRDVEAGSAVGEGSFINLSPETPTVPAAPLPQKPPKSPPRREQTPKTTPILPNPKSLQNRPCPANRAFTIYCPNAPVKPSKRTCVPPSKKCSWKLKNSTTTHSAMFSSSKIRPAHSTRCGKT